MSITAISIAITLTILWCSTIAVTPTISRHFTRRAIAQRVQTRSASPSPATGPGSAETDLTWLLRHPQHPAQVPDSTDVFVCRLLCGHNIQRTRGDQWFSPDLTNHHTGRAHRLILTIDSNQITPMHSDTISRWLLAGHGIGFLYVCLLAGISDQEINQHLDGTLDLDEQAITTLLALQEG